MTRRFEIWAVLAAAAVLVTGCSGPEQKLGRGVRNLTEVVRLGELRRSVEQSALYENPDYAYTTGMATGVRKTLTRTFVGAGQIITFPIPPYEEPWLKPGSRLMSDATVDTVYPDNYRPQVYTDSTFESDGTLGFSGGDIAPMIPGSRFRIFDY